MPNNPIIERVCEAFKEKFPQGEVYANGRTSGPKTTVVIGSSDEIISFIRTSLTLALAEQREQIVEAIGKGNGETMEYRRTHSIPEICGFDDGRSTAQEIINTYKPE